VTHLEQIDRALHAVGKRLVVEISDAAWGRRQKERPAEDCAPTGRSKLAKI
jgi:hypothetical protein